MNRSHFLQISTLAGLGLLLAPQSVFARKSKSLKISLAQWSLHKAHFDGKMTTLDFPSVARNVYDVDAIEFVNQFFSDRAEDKDYLSKLKLACENHRITPLLIMVDNEGSLSDANEKARHQAVINHVKWIRAASYLGCHSIRVNLHGAESQSEWKASSIASLKELSIIGSKYNVSVLVENHGSHSSNGKLLAEIMNEVNHEFCGTLPDFGNFCLRRRDGDMWASPCVDEYDKYKGVEEMLPYAKSVSAKAYGFDDSGMESTIDYTRMIELVKNSQYQGYIGIEYEGNGLSEEEGIRSTIQLLKKLI